MVSFGILGCGGIAARFAGALKASKDAVLLGCAARERGRAEAFAARHGCKAYDGYASLLDDPAIQAVYIATVHSTHAALARAAVLAGKAVLCEKPFFIHAAEGREIVSLAREKRILLMEGFWTRTQPAYQRAMAWLREGRIGELRLIRAAFCFAMPLDSQTQRHRIWNPDTAGGALWDAGVYPYQFATGILGEGPEELSALVTRAPTGVDMSVSMALRFRNGVLASLLASVGAEMDSVGVLSGSEGQIRLEYFLGSRHASLYEGGRLADSFDDPEPEGFVHEIAHFARLMERGSLESEINPLALTLDFTERAERILT